MCRDEPQLNCFIISRNNELLKDRLKLCLLNPSGYDFSWEHGEFCAFLFDKTTNRIAFGRDIFGRKSLCWRITSAEQQDKCVFELSILPGGQINVAADEEEKWAETPPGTLVILQLSNPPITVLTPLNSTLICDKTKFMMNSPILDFYSLLDCKKADFLAQKVFIQSYYPHCQLKENPLLQKFTNIDFVQITSDIFPNHDQNGHGQAQVSSTMIQTLDVSVVEIANLTQEFIKKFNFAVENILRVVALMPKIKTIDESIQNMDCDFANLHVPVLFSGGVDSLMVALSAGDTLFRLAKETADNKAFAGKIYLISVAFGEKQEDYLQASDRTQSIVAFENLRQRSLAKHGSNPYSLILVNVSKSELVECRHKFIANAIFPSNTVLDDSIGCVLWFAARMIGVEYGSNYNDENETIKRIINSQMLPFALVGSGSDEQLGGYARHRTVFEKKGLPGLTAELSMEMHRIGERNLGRDDRVGMSNGRAIFAPFLEEHFVRWLNSVPTHLKTGFALSPSLSAFPSTTAANADIYGLTAAGNNMTSDCCTNSSSLYINNNKFLLRNSLRVLGMPELVVTRPKRAMQFGSRIVKLEKLPGQKGSDVCVRLLAPHSQEQKKCFDK